MSNFIIWHLLAICTVMAVSFLIGYSTAIQQQQKRKNKVWNKQSRKS